MKLYRYLFIFIISFAATYSLPDISNQTGVCVAVEQFIFETSNAPGKIEFLEVSSIMEFENGLFAQRIKFRDSSDPDNPTTFNFIFLMDGDYDNVKVLTVGKPDEFINSVVNNDFRVRTLYSTDGSIILD